MFKWIADIISKVFGGLNVKALYKSSYNSVGGDSVKSPQVGHDATTIYADKIEQFSINISLPDLRSNYEMDFKKFAQEYLNYLSQDVITKQGLDIRNIFSVPSNYMAFNNAVHQLYLGQNNYIEKRHLLSTLLLQKFRSDESDVDIYLQAIKTVENLTIRDLKILSLINFITILSRVWYREKIEKNSLIIKKILKEIDNVDIEEIRNLEHLGVLCSLFPYMYDNSDFIELHKFVPELYDSCQLFIANHPFITGFKITLLGRVVTKSFMSTCYDIESECIMTAGVPIKMADLNVGNVFASGNIAADGEVSSGGIVDG